MKQMTPKERRDAQIQLGDMANELYYGTLDESVRGSDRIKKRQEQQRQAQFLRAVAAELDHVPEVQ